ncbi:MAG: hypothetical protein LBD86_00155, partial [Spirochaetaceae bacterium]|nr:hypothetical protein [Spirochaetaceae bacterium]
MKKIRKIMIVLLSVVSWWGVGGYVTSCKLEASVDSPSEIPANLPAGMPGEIQVYGPIITSDGTGVTTTLSYSVEADFSQWGTVGAAGSAFVYTAQKGYDNLGAATAQSIEALILGYGTLAPYGTLGTALIQSATSGNVDSTLTGGTYSLTPQDDPNSRFVILPLDTELVRRELIKKSPLNTGDSSSIFWIEDNSEGIKKGLAGSTAWGGGTYAQNGIRIMGGTVDDKDTFSVKSTTIKNFDDGKDSRPRSIGTVLLAGNESVINFYD